MARRDDDRALGPQGTVDPLIDEVRTARRWLSDRFDNDVDRLVDHLQELEEQHPERVVRELPDASTDAGAAVVHERAVGGSDLDDPLIDEVREIRRQLSERFDNDVFKLGAHLMKLQEEHGDRLVREVPPPSTSEPK